MKFQSISNTLCRNSFVNASFLALVAIGKISKIGKEEFQPKDIY